MRTIEQLKADAWEKREQLNADDVPMDSRLRIFDVTSKEWTTYFLLEGYKTIYGLMVQVDESKHDQVQESKIQDC